MQTNFIESVPSPSPREIAFTHFTRAFSHGVPASILVFQNNETAAILVFQNSPVRVDFSDMQLKDAFFCSCKFA